jgi:hypothetical protein
MRWFKALLGGLLVLWCPVMLLAPRWPALVVGGRWGDGLAGMAGGVLGGVGGFTGVVPTLWCTLRRYPKELQRAVIQNFNLSMLLVTMAVYLGTGMVTREMLPLCAVVAPAMLLPTWLGTRLYIGISEARFRQLVLGLLTLSGGHAGGGSAATAGSVLNQQGGAVRGIVGLGFLRAAPCKTGTRRSLLECVHCALRQRSAGLDHALGLHGVGHLHKAGDVGAVDVADGAVGTLAVLHAGCVDALHDLQQTGVHFFGRPAQAGRVLRHFQARGGHATGVGCLAGAYSTPAASKALAASMVEGMLAPSATQITPLAIRVLASASSSSFWVAQGRATSTLMDQGACRPGIPRPSCAA